MQCHFANQFISSSFIIVAQPTDRDGHPVTQYQKTGKSHSADIKTRVICLLDAQLRDSLLRLSDIGTISVDMPMTHPLILLSDLRCDTMSLGYGEFGKCGAAAIS